MNRLRLRLSHMPVIASLLFLAFSSVVFGQCPSGDACYTITGTLELDPNNKGKDVFGLVGTVVTASANISQTLAPSSSSTPTSTSSSNTYAVQVQLDTVPINATVASTVTLTDNPPLLFHELQQDSNHEPLVSDAVWHNPSRPTLSLAGCRRS